jgi:bifunctional DNA-binding transcriptional regulator/antitoxin component of YhaV-PrlF toxin-antitoxin module
MSPEIVQMRRKGVITLPVGLRRKYDLNEGEIFTLVDLGNGAFVLSQRPSTFARLADKIRAIWREDKVTLDDLLKTLEEERERYYQEHYVNPRP